MAWQLLPQAQTCGERTMADADELDLADEAPGGRKPRLLVLASLGLAAVLLLGGGAAAFLYFGGFLDGGEGADMADAAGAEAPPAPREPATYVPLDPAFTVNLKAPSSARYLQISLQALTRDESVAGKVKAHGPAIRNNLVMLLSSKTSQDLESRAGKEALQGEIVDAINQVLQSHAGGGRVEDVLFTTFVMQ